MRFPRAQEAWVRMGREGERKEWRKEARQSSRKLASLKEKELHSHTKLQAQAEWRQHLSETVIENKHSQNPDSTSLQSDGGDEGGEGIEGEVGGWRVEGWRVEGWRGGGDCCTHSDSGVSCLILAQAEGEGEGQTLNRHLRKSNGCEQLALCHRIKLAHFELFKCCISNGSQDVAGLCTCRSTGGGVLQVSGEGAPSQEECLPQLGYLWAGWEGSTELLKHLKGGGNKIETKMVTCKHQYQP